MKATSPRVFLIGRSAPDWGEVENYLDEVGGGAADWVLGQENENGVPDEQGLVEFGGRLCYRSWRPGLNPNVTKVRTDQDLYLANILESKHGSVTEHVTYSFVFRHVSRVLTHELTRHRVGVAVSQESMRYVRLTDIPFWFPDWAKEDPELLRQAGDILARLEWFQGWMASHFGLDQEGIPFRNKKKYTSFMRRFAPDGVATDIMWTANIRTLRHVIETRTAEGAEEEIRLVFGRVAEIMRVEAPALFGDFEKAESGAWVPKWSKV